MMNECCSLRKCDVEEHRTSVNTLLLKTSELVRFEARSRHKSRSGQKAQSGRQKTIDPGADLSIAQQTVFKPRRFSYVQRSTSEINIAY